MRKKGKKHQSRAAGFYVGPQFISTMEAVRLSNLHRPLRDEEIEHLGNSIPDFIAACMQGCAKYEQFWSVIEDGYNMLKLIEVLMAKKQLAGNGNADDEERIRAEFKAVYAQTIEWLEEVFVAIKTRQEKTGKFGITAFERDRLEFVNRNWIALLELSNYSDWFKSLKATSQMVRHLRAQATLKVQTA